jgi:hypothetical protein
MTHSIDDAIRIARREAELGHASRPTDRAVSAVFSALATLPDPDVEGQPIKKDWRWESDGVGPVAKRRDQYIVAEGGLERIATFEGPDAAKNARAASCTPMLIAALKSAEAAMSEIDATRDSGTEPVFVKEIAEVRRALKETRFRKSG